MIIFIILASFLIYFKHLLYKERRASVQSSHTTATYETNPEYLIERLRKSEGTCIMSYLKFMDMNIGEVLCPMNDRQNKGFCFFKFRFYAV